MMSKVYVVTSGCYSSYGIRAMFTNREAAETLIEEWKLKGDYWAQDADIEEWTLDLEVRPDDYHTRVSVRLDESGNVLSVKVGEDECSDWCWFRGYGQTNAEFSGVVWAKSTEHAIKQAVDARAASIAAGDLDALRSKQGPHMQYQRVSL